MPGTPRGGHSSSEQCNAPLHTYTKNVTQQKMLLILLMLVNVPTDRRCFLPTPFNSYESSTRPFHKISLHST